MGLLGWAVNAVIGSAVVGAVEVCQNVGETIDKVGHAICGRSTSYEAARKSQKNCLVLKVLRRHDKGLSSTMKNLFDKNSNLIEHYYFIDKDGNIKYKGMYRYSVFTKKMEKNFMMIDLYDSSNTVVGSIKGHVHKEWNAEVRTYSLYIGDNKIFDIIKHEKFPDIHVNSGQEWFNANFNKFNAYELKSKDGQVAKLNISRMEDKDNYTNKYALEYENMENEVLSVLFAMAVDRVNG